MDQKRKSDLCFFPPKGEKGIDLTKVDTTRNIGDFDQEAQAAIERVTYDHHMKMLGKPTSSEQVRTN